MQRSEFPGPAPSHGFARSTSVSRPLLGGVGAAHREHLLGRTPSQIMHVLETMSEAPDPQGQRTELDDQIVQLAFRHMSAEHIPPRAVGFSVIAQVLGTSTRAHPL